MSAVSDRIDTLIDDYLSGKLRFMHFWTSFMDCWADPELTDRDQEAYAEAYDVVYMGSAGPVAAHDATLGLLTEPEVQARLRAFRKRSPTTPPG